MWNFRLKLRKGELQVKELCVLSLNIFFFLKKLTVLIDTSYPILSFPFLPTNVSHSDKRLAKVTSLL